MAFNPLIAPDLRRALRSRMAAKITTPGNRGPRPQVWKLFCAIEDFAREKYAHMRTAMPVR